MDEITQIKQKLNIVDIIGNYVELKKSGKNYKGVCPFHTENTPSFMVSPDLQIYKCFGCNEGGDIFAFVQKIEGIEFYDALKKLGEMAGIEVKTSHGSKDTEQKNTIYTINEVTTRFYEHLLLNHKAGKQACDYLITKRKLTNDTIKVFRLGYAPYEWDILYSFLLKRGFSDKDLLIAGVIKQKNNESGYIDKFRNRIVFPLIDNNEKVVGFTARSLDNTEPKYLNTQETLVFKKSMYIYGLVQNKVEIKKQGAMFVEGQMDVLSAYQADIKNVIASSGTALTAQQLQILARYTKELTLCFDNDTAGQNATLRAIELAETQDFNIRVAIIPKAYKDLDELIKQDIDKAKKLSKEAIPIYDYFLVNALDQHDKDKPYGKKKIIEELAPKLAKIKNTVVLDHYIKKISEEVDIETTVLIDIVKEKNAETTQELIKKALKQTKTSTQDEIQKREEYFLSLLLRADIAILRDMLYKLAENDFSNKFTQNLFLELKKYIENLGTGFNIKEFINKLNTQQSDFAQKLYLADISINIEDSKQFGKELDNIYKRIKQDSISRSLEDLVKELKKAELEMNIERIEDLSQKVFKFSKQKREYEQDN